MTRTQKIKKYTFEAVIIGVFALILLGFAMCNQNLVLYQQISHGMMGI